MGLCVLLKSRCTLMPLTGMKERVYLLKPDSPCGPKEKLYVDYVIPFSSITQPVSQFRICSKRSNEEALRFSTGSKYSKNKWQEHWKPHQMHLAPANTTKGTIFPLSSEMSYL